MKKRISSIFIIVAMLIGTIGMQIPLASAEESVSGTMMFENVDYAKSSNIRVIIDGKQVVFEVSPQAINGRIMVPMSAIFRELGLTVSWDSVTKTAQGTNADTSIIFTINNNKALVNGQEQILDVPAMAINNKTMIPLRFLSENMGYNIVWVQTSNLILMSKSTIIEWRYYGYEKVAPYREYEYKYINGTRTEEMRYNGKNHDVKFYTLYSSNGKLIQNVPEFDIARYGSGWDTKSPFVGKTYWIDLDTTGATDGNSRFYDSNNLTAIETELLRSSASAGNYLKVKIEDHYFNLDAWKKIDASSESELNYVQDEKSLDGKIIPKYDTMFMVTINDKYKAFISLEFLTGSLFAPDMGKNNIVFQKDPKMIFNWSESEWNRLKGETPWTGMTGDMLIVQRQQKPDKTSKIKTRFSVLELWVYEDAYVDSVFYFDDGILTSMW